MFALAFDNKLFLAFVKKHLECFAEFLGFKVPQVFFLSSLAQKKSLFLCATRVIVSDTSMLTQPAVPATAYIPNMRITDPFQDPQKKSIALYILARTWTQMVRLAGLLNRLSC